MNNLLIYFALPIATIILSIILQKLIKCPLAVASIFFAIYLVVTFAAFDINFLILAILYTILAYVTALLTKVILNLIKEHNCNECNDETLNVSTINTDVLNTNTIMNDSNNNSNCRYNRYRRF